jgi:hypothetical protein
VALLALGLVLPAVIGGPNDTPKPTTPAVSSPPASPSVTSPPASSSPSISPRPSTLDDAVTQFRNLLETGVASGAIDDHAAGELSKGVDETLKEFIDHGDAQKAAEKLQEASDKVDEFLSDGTITSQDFAAELHRSIDAIGAQMAATSPPSGEGHGHGNEQGSGKGDEQG